MKKLAQLGEEGLLHLLTGRWKKPTGRGEVGVGDDCAILRVAGKNLLFKTDAVVEGVHFTKRTSPVLIGRKALARALSDLAAMGGRPLAALVTLGLPPDESPRRLASMYRGLEKIALLYDVALVGGETTRARQLFLSIALLGEAAHPVLRSSARAGDLVFVTGRLGGTQARHHLTFTPRLAEGGWLAQKKFATAMMDLSDGLGADLPRLARASGLGFDLDLAAIPSSRGVTPEAALTEGEDYELLFTVAPDRADLLKKEWPFVTPMHCIGAMRKGRPGDSASVHGFDHFKQRRGRAGLRRKLGR